MADKFDEASLEALRRRHARGRALPERGQSARGGRTAQLNVRVAPTLKIEVERLANAHGLMICEVIEKAIDALKREQAEVEERSDASSD